MFRCQGRNAKNLKKTFLKFVTGCDIKATKCDKKNYRKISSQILWHYVVDYGLKNFYTHNDEMKKCFRLT